MKSISSRIKYAGLGLATVSTLAVAIVTFDAATGTGFVGKGDVQTPFNLNNTQLQNLLTSCPNTDAGTCPLSFQFSSTAHYLATCTWTTGENSPNGAKVHNIDLNRVAGVRGTLAYDVRRATQATGFNLTGYDGTGQTFGTVPVVGGQCVGGGEGSDGNGQDGTWTVVEFVGATSNGLQACLESAQVTGRGKNQTITIVTSCATISP